MPTTRQLKTKTEKVNELEDRIASLENDVKALRKQNQVVTKILDEMTKAPTPKPTPPTKSVK